MIATASLQVWNEQRRTLAISLRVVCWPGSGLRDSFVFSGAAFRRPFVYAGHKLATRKLEQPQFLLLDVPVRVLPLRPALGAPQHPTRTLFIVTCNHLGLGSRVAVGYWGEGYIAKIQFVYLPQQHCLCFQLRVMMRCIPCGSVHATLQHCCPLDLFRASDVPCVYFAMLCVHAALCPF